MNPIHIPLSREIHRERTTTRPWHHEFHWGAAQPGLWARSMRWLTMKSGSLGQRRQPSSQRSASTSGSAL